MTPTPPQPSPRAEAESRAEVKSGPFAKRIIRVVLVIVAGLTIGACSISSAAEDGPSLPAHPTSGQVIQKCTDFIANYTGSDQAQLYATCMATAKALIEKGH